VKNDPANNFALYDVSNAFQKIGDVRLARGDLGGRSRPTGNPKRWRSNWPTRIARTAPGRRTWP